MPTLRQCAECGASLPSDAPDGLCPACAFHAALTVAPTPSAYFQPSALFDPPTDPKPAPAPSPLRRFGDYELLEEIARGGMGVVYRARQVSLNRIVAVKMILAGQLASDSDVRRFRAEAELAAQLQHPHIVAIHEIGQHEGQHYFSMDYVEGRNLSRVISDSRSAVADFEQMARWMKAIAEAIHYAHQRGVLHRDLKSSNVIIDRNDQPRITDFGLARRLTSDFGLRASDLTLTGQMLGSPNFMPPEQVTGGQVGLHSDIYSLGAILYHLLTGRPPFVAGTLTAILQEVQHIDPISPRLLNPDVPRDLETICLRCLEKDPSSRYATAHALADELGRFLGGELVLAQPVSRATKWWRWWTCHPKLAAAAAFSITTLLMSLGLGSYLVPSHNQLSPKPVLSQQAVRGSSGESKTIAGGGTQIDSAPFLITAQGFYHVTQDLICTGTGITILADDIDLDLGGHTLSGDGSGEGVSVTRGANVSIHHGTVQRFKVGIHLLATFNTKLHNLTANQNTLTGILGEGAIDTAVTDNTASHNGDIGILFHVRSRGNTLSRNTADRNGRDGITVADAFSNTVTTIIANQNGSNGICLDGFTATNNVNGNRAFDNRNNGINLRNASGNILSGNTTGRNFAGIHLDGDSHGNIIVSNLASANSGEGIRLINGPTLNTIRDNAVSENRRGIWLGNGGANQNTIQNNTATLNVVGILVDQGCDGNMLLSNTALTSRQIDIEDDNPQCGSNTWTNNKFATDIVAGASDGGPGRGCVQ